LVEEKEVAIATALERIEQMLDECRQQALLVTDLQSQLSEKDGEAVAKEVESSSAIALLTQQVTELESARMLAKEHVATLEVSFETERQNAAHELSKKISQLKSDLSRVETDCYSMKDANVELQEKQTKLDARATDLEGVLNLTRDQLATEKMEKLSLQEKLQALEKQSAVFKSQVFAAKASFEADAQARLADGEYQLNDALHQLSESRKEVKASRMNVADLNSDIDKYRREIDSIKCMPSNENGLEMSKLRKELAQTKLDLTHSEADCFAARLELKSAKEKVSAVKKHEYEKQQKFAAKAKEAIETLKGRLAKAESIQNGPKVAESLQDELKALKKTIDEKDERIKKLENSKITKTHIANIKKLKVRNKVACHNYRVVSLSNETIVSLQRLIIAIIIRIG